jgi:hypothetical protein
MLTRLAGNALGAKLVPFYKPLLTSDNRSFHSIHSAVCKPVHFIVTIVTTVTAAPARQTVFEAVSAALGIRDSCDDSDAAIHTSCVILMSR